MRGVIIFFVLGLLVAACTADKERNGLNLNTTGEPASEPAPQDATPDTSDAAPDTYEDQAETPEEPAATPGEPQLRQCTRTIPYQTLINALPKRAGGFAAQNPEGTTLTWTDPANPNNNVKYSTASEVLTSDESSVIISMLDTCYVQYLATSWSSRAAFNGTQGFMQQATVEGYPAWEQFASDSNTYAFNILVEDRVLVTVQGTEGVPERDVRTVAEAVDYAGLTAATIEP